MATNFVGSKGAAGVAQRIVSLMPPHDIYIEAFAGLAVVGRLKKPADLQLFVEKDPSTVERLRLFLPRDAHLVNADVMQSIKPESVPPSAVVYCDPPYLGMTRRGRQRKYYQCELTEEVDHLRFLEWVRRLPCRVLVSGYYSDLYERTLAGWRSVSFGAGTRRGRAVEFVWLNFPEPAYLHDSRFVGDGFRERERIQRKIRRWTTRLSSLPPAERAAVLAAFDDAGLPRRAPLPLQKWRV